MTGEALSRRLWIATTVGLVLVAIGVRLFLNFSHVYPPGVNAAYYPLQTRTWLTQGRLMYDDLPLIFWMNAGLSKVLMAAGRPLDDAVLLASRLLDSILEPFAAVAIMAIGYVWSAGARKALFGCLAAGILVVLSPQVMRMLSDFEKNSLGLVFMSLAILACRSAIDNRRAGSWALLAAILVLVSVTHVGAFAVTMTIVCGAISVWGVLSLRRTRAAAGTLLLAAGGLGALIALLAFFDSHRAQRLLRAPVQVFKSGSMESLPIPIMIIAAIVIATALHRAWRDRARLAAGDLAIVMATAATTALLALPKSFVYFDRLLLMAPVPAGVLLAFIMARGQRLALWGGPILFALSLLAATTGPEAVQPPFMSQEVAGELRTLKQQITDPGSTLVIAPHGLEWWAGYILGTPVRSEVPRDASGQYRHVVWLRNTVDCPRDLASPFGAPPVADGVRKVFAGQCLEAFQN